MGDNIFRKLNISLNTFQTNIPNEYNAFEKAPKLSNSGYKFLYLEVSDPTMSELYVGETFVEGKKRKIPLPTQGKVDFFDWGKTESEYVVIISPNTNERVNGSSSVWVLNDNPNKKDINIKTFGHKIHSAQISNSRKFMIFSQKLSSAENYKNYDLYYVNLNNTNLERITPKDDLMDINPVISPNDTKIAYMSSEDSKNFKLFVANIDGTDRRQVSDLYISDIPCWLNSTEIIVVDPFANMFKVNILTGDNELLIDGYDKLDIEKEMEKLEQQKISN
jgi:Tol biopolymer transport system component